MIIPKLISHTDYSLTLEIADGELLIIIHTCSQVSQRLVNEMYKGIFGTKRYHRSYVSVVVDHTEFRYRQRYYSKTMEEFMS